MHATLPLLKATDFPPIRRRVVETLQVNLGYKCNQSCVHCHVNAGPTRTEMMDGETVQDVIAFLKASGVTTLDITGGAPELNPSFCFLVERARQLGMSRTTFRNASDPIEVPPKSPRRPRGTVAGPIFDEADPMPLCGHPR